MGMQLSNVLFKQIITQLKGLSGDASNKRRAPRVGLSAKSLSAR
jgi:hypothetical protein